MVAIPALLTLAQLVALDARPKALTILLLAATLATIASLECVMSNNLCVSLAVNFVLDDFTVEGFRVAV